MRAAALRSEPTPHLDVLIAGEACVLDATGALYLSDHATLVVADLHLEKGSSFARRGSMLPPYDTSATLAALADVVARFTPARVVALGDSFHDRSGPDRLGTAERDTLAALVSCCDWTWITGNHDPVLPSALGGTVTGEASMGALTLRHHPAHGACRELAGHLHPVAKVVRRGQGVRCRAFLTDGERCVLPAFGAYAGGLNACDKAFAPLFAETFVAHIIGTNRFFTLPRSVLCGD